MIIIIVVVIIIVVIVITVINNPTITNFSSTECKFKLTSLVLSNFVTGRILGQHIAN